MPDSFPSKDISLERIVEIASIFRGSELRGMSAEQIDELLNLIYPALIFNPVIYDHGHICYRARRCPVEGWPNVRNCLNPPEGCADFGRASLPHEPVIYSSWNLPTALDEIGAMVGDTVQIVGINVVGGKSINHYAIGDFQRYQNSGRSLWDDPEGGSIYRRMQREQNAIYSKALYVDSLLAELFASKYAKQHELRVTAHVASTIFRSNLGIVYPSVRAPHSMNIAMHRNLFNSHCQVIYSEVLRIKQLWGYSMYAVERLRWSTGFHSDGTIDWSRVDAPKVPRGKYGSPEPPAETPGWIDPSSQPTKY